jgi:hemerythrin superfamily protein
MPKSINALDLLRKEHRAVLSLLQRFDRTDDEREQRDLCQQIVEELEAHTTLEEECFYPFVREATGRADLIEEATIEHATAKDLIDELRGRDQDAVHFHALGKVLGEYVSMHVREEEEQIFPVVEKLGVDLDALGAELVAYRSGDANEEDEGGDAAGGGRQARERDRQSRDREQSRGGESKARGARSKSGTKRDEREGHAKREGANGDARRENGRQREDQADMKEDDEEFLREHAEGLSKSTQRAKWIHSPDEHAERPGQTLATRNPEVIRQWAGHRKAEPATTPGGDTERPRVLRFDFPAYDDTLQHVSWEAWLRVFQDRDLVFLFQAQKADGADSNFFRLDNPEREDA